MTGVGLTSLLRILASRKRDYPLHGDSMDWCARAAICEAVPPTSRTPVPWRRDVSVEANEPARNAWLRVYQDLYESVPTDAASDVSDLTCEDA